MLKSRRAELRGKAVREDAMRRGVARRADLNMLGEIAATFDGSASVL